VGLKGDGSVSEFIWQLGLCDRVNECKKTLSPPFDNIKSYGDRLAVKREYYLFHVANVLPLKWTQLTKTVHTARLGLEFVFLCLF